MKRIFIPPARTKPVDLVGYVFTHVPPIRGAQVGGNSATADTVRTLMAQRGNDGVLGLEPSAEGQGWYFYTTSRQNADNCRETASQSAYAAAFKKFGPTTHVYATGEIFQTTADGTWEELQPLWGTSPAPDPWEWHPE